MPVKGLVPGLLEIGKIKIGKKGKTVESAGGKEFRPPEKLDHFIITTNEKIDDDYVVDQALMDRLKQTGQAMLNQAGELVGIPIRLLYNETDLNFPTRYASYVSGRLSCTGNGETARTADGRDVPCPCERLDPNYAGKDKCKINGVLTCVIDGMDMFGGCHKFRTTSRNTCQSIIGSLELLRVATGGAVSFLPLSLVVQPKSTTTQAGQRVTVYVVSVVYRGTLEELQQTSIENAKGRHQYLIAMQEIDSIVSAWGSDESETVDEFYPESVEKPAKTDKEPAKTAKTVEKPVEPATTINEEAKDDATGQVQCAPVPAVDEDDGQKKEEPAPQADAGPGDEVPKTPAPKSPGKKAKTEPEAKPEPGNGTSQPDACGPPAADPGGAPGAPFGGKQPEIIQAYKELIRWDREQWKKALSSIGLSLPDVEIDNVCKSQKWSDRTVWVNVLARFKPDDISTEDVETIVANTLKSIIKTGRGKAIWEEALARYNVTSARFITEAKVDDFLKLIEEDVPF